MSDESAYYRRASEGRYEATRLTESPWSRTQQHGGPPLALAVHAMLRAHPSEERRPVGVTLDFLGPVPLATVEIETAVRRPGTRIDLLEARLSSEGRAFAEVRLWRARHDAALAVPAAGVATEALAIPEPQSQRFFEGLEGWGYGESIDWRFVKGDLRTLGATSVWTRVRGLLVEGEDPSPLERALVVADSANGVSAVLPMRDWLFVPTRIAVSFARDPAGEWIRLDAETTAGPDGRAICRASLSDAAGLMASIDQAIFVARR